MSADAPNRPTLSLSLSGPITLYESVEVREVLRAAVAEGKDMRIDLDASGPWDLAGLQLLISLVNTADKAGLAVHLMNVPNVCREVAERSGLADWLAETTETLG